MPVDQSMTEYFLNIDGNLPNGSIPIYTNYDIEKVNIVRLNNAYSVIIYKENTTRLLKGIIVQKNKKLYNFSNTFVLSIEEVGDISACKYDDNSIMLAFVINNNGIIKTKLSKLLIPQDLIEGINVKSLEINEEFNIILNTGPVVNLQMIMINDNGILSYSDHPNGGYGIIRKFSITSSIISIEEPIVFNDTYTKNIKLLYTSGNQIALTYQQYYLGCNLIIRFIDLDTILTIGDKFIIDSFNRICPIDTVFINDNIYVAYYNFESNTIKVLKIDTLSTPIVFTYIDINEQDVEDISICSIENGDYLIIFNNKENKTNAICTKNNIVKSKYIFSTYRNINRILLLNYTHITYIGDNSIQNIGINRTKYSTPSIPTQDDEDTTSYSVILHSDPEAIIRLYIDGFENDNIIENGTEVESKLSGIPWVWLDNEITYKAFAYREDDDNGYRSDNTEIITVTLKSEQTDNGEVVLYGLMSDGSKGKVNLNDMTITSSNNDIVSPGLTISNFGKLLLVQPGDAVITIEDNTGKKTYLSVKVVG